MEIFVETQEINSIAVPVVGKKEKKTNKYHLSNEQLHRFFDSSNDENRLGLAFQMKCYQLTPTEFSFQEFLQQFTGNQVTTCFDKTKTH